jgi:hypothetical protein
MRNPLSRRRRDPLQQALDAIEDVRSEAARRAEDLRDAAAQAVDLLGEAVPESRRHRVPIALGLIAAAVGTAVALRARGRTPQLPPTPEQPREPRAATAESEAAQEGATT